MTLAPQLLQQEIQAIVRGGGNGLRESVGTEAPSEAERFCRAVLPSQGYLCLVIFVGGKPTKTEWFTTSAELARRAMVHPDLGIADFYVSTAAFRDSSTRDGSNVEYKRALYLDLDVGSRYPFKSLSDAIAQLERFCRESGIPAPGIVIESGHGLHIYWPLNQNVSADDWQEMASHLKEACDIWNFPADSQVTADVARILRIPGTHNRKVVGHPSPVTMPYEKGSFDVTALRPALSQAARRPATAKPIVANPDDLKAGIPASSTAWFDELSENQRQIALREMLGALPDSAADEYGEWIQTLAEVASAGSVPWDVRVDAAWEFSRRSKKSEEETRDTVAKTMSTLGSRTNISALRNRVRGIYQVPGTRAAHGYRDHASAEQGLTSGYAHVADVDMYIDLNRRKLISKAALKEVESWRMPPITSGGRSDPLGILRGSPRTQRCSSVGFHPGAPATYSEDGELLANLFYHNVPDPIEPTRSELRLLTRFLRHLFPRGTDLAWLRHLLDTYAYLLQNPGERVSFTMILVGAVEGSGKSTLMEEIPRLLFGEHNVVTVSTHELESQFTDWLARAWLVVYAEVSLGRSREATKIANALKDNQTNRFLRIHEKNKPGRSQRNRVSFFATSNDETHALHVTQFDRRSGICSTSAKPMPTTLSKSLYMFLKSPRASGVLRHLFVARSVRLFNPAAAPPTTDAKIRMIEQSRDPIHAELVESWELREPPFDRDFGSLESVRACLFGRNVDVRNLSDKRLGDFLKRPPLNTKRMEHQRKIVSDRLGINRRIRFWLWRNAGAWTQMPESALTRHLEYGGPPIESVQVDATKSAPPPTPDLPSVPQESVTPCVLRSDSCHSNEVRRESGTSSAVGLQTVYSHE